MSHPATSSVDEGGGATVPLRFGALRRLAPLLRRPSAAIGTLIAVLFLCMALGAPWLAPYTATGRIPADARQGPSPAHWFGTDHLGRDVFSRVVVGAQSILALAGLGTLLAVLLGTAVGLFSGYRGGWLDELLMRGFDGLLAIPALLLALLLLGTLGPSRESVLWVIVIVYTPIVARVARSEALRVKPMGFIRAAQLRGESTAFLLFREILPCALPALSVEAALRFSYAIFLTASLGFLGLGVQPPTPDWGLMVKEYRTYASLTPWAMLFPAMAISLVVVGVNLMADGLKHVLQLEPVPARAPAQASAAQPAAADSTGALLEVQSLSVDYGREGGRLEALREVSLSIEAGQSYGLVGESGSGKSTLALAILRQLSAGGRVRGGHIRFEGQDALALPERALRRLRGARLSLVPQNPLASLNPSLTVGEQIAELLRRHLGHGRARAWDQTLAWLRKVQIADPQRVARSYPHQLSGGMQQRVMIAMAFCTAPRLVLLDEPTTGLDVTTEAVVLDLLKDLMRQEGTAALYVSHNLTVVAAVAQRVAVLYAGEVVEDAPSAELFSKPLHPYTQGLLDSVPDPSRHKSQGPLRSMPGSIPRPREIAQGCAFAPRCPLAQERCRRERPALEMASEAGLARRVRCHRWREVWGHGARVIAPVQAPTPSPPGEAIPALHVVQLSAHFPLRRSLLQLLQGAPRRAVKAVDGVTFQVPQGQTLGLVGESGSGKTTLARALYGLIPHVRGRVELHGQPLAASIHRRNRASLRQVQGVAQNPEEALNPYMTVGQSLRRPLMRLLGQTKAQAQQRAAQLLERVGLRTQDTGRLPGQLSGGEQQRVAIARAFAADPKLIVCDEPTSALDVSVQARVLNLLNELQRERGSSTLFISHDLGAVAYVSDWIAVIYLGQLMEIGPAPAFFGLPHHPYTEALLSALPSLRPRLQSAIRLQGESPSPTDQIEGCPFHTRCPRSLGERCVREKPAWQVDGQGHAVYCHIPLAQLGAGLIDVE